MNTVKDSLIITHKDVISTIIVGLSSICIAYASFSSSLLGSNATKNYAKSTTQTIEANTTYLEASRNYENSTEEESQAEQARYEEEITLADEYIQEAETADGLSDRYLLYTVLFGSLMFFASLPSVLSNKKLIIVLISISLLGFIVLAGGLFSLPKM